MISSSWVSIGYLISASLFILGLKKLGHPERKFNNVINFLGSSGKYTTLYSVKSFIEANNQSASAYISPSLKSFISTSPNGIPKESVILLANAKFDLPLNTFIFLLGDRESNPDSMDQNHVSCH